MNTIGTYPFTVRGYECGPEGAAHLATVMNFLQEAATLQAQDCGFSRDDFAAAGVNIGWVLTRVHLKMTRYPRHGETVCVATWPCGGRKIVAERDFELTVNDEVIGVATSEWVILDLATRKIAAVPQSVYDKANDERPRALGERAFLRLRWHGPAPTAEAPRFRARRGDIDVNGHVNNVHYVEWLAESLPESLLRPSDFEIVYKSETLAGDEVVAEAARQADGAYLARVAAPDGRDHVVARLLGV